MKRRGFLGFLGGAAVAGPGMVKAAAQQTMADLSVGGMPMLGDVGMNVMGTADGPWAGDGSIDKVLYLRKRIASIVGMSDAVRRRKMRLLSVSSLDPDLASLRSVSLSAKVEMQRARNFDAEMRRERGWLERDLNHLLGIEEDDA